MMNIKRTLAALLAGMILVGSLAACAKSVDGEDTDEEDTVDAETEEETLLVDDLPNDLNYGQDEVTIISRDLEGWTRGEISVNSLISEPVNDAVYERNKSVEQRLNIRLNSILDDSSDPNVVVNKVSTAVKAGTGEYDILASACYTTLPETLNGTFNNLRSITHINFSQPWWTQGFNEVVEFEGAQYVATGDALITLYRMAFVTVFNQNLFQDAGQPFLYEYVEDGTWTLDKQIRMVPLFHKDNGNGVQDDKGDIYGFSSGTMASIDAYWSSCKVDIISKNTDGEYEIVMDMDRLHGAADKILELFHNTDGASRIYNAHGFGGEHDDIRELFANGYSAMATLRILELERSSMRNMEHKYGVVPMPKYDESQDDYYTLLHDQFTVFAVPVTVTGARLDEVGAVLEAMASASFRIIKPAYYETTLRTKIAQDPQSAELMDLITRNVYIDAGIIYVASLPGYQGGLRSLVISKKNDTVSRFTTMNKMAKSNLRAIVKRLERVADNQSR